MTSFSLPFTLNKSRVSLLLFFLFSGVFSIAQSKDEMSIRKVMQYQENAWNRGQLDMYMQGYWKNDSLMFIGKSGITYGWQQTLDNYKKGYPDTANMGRLSFKLLHLNAVDHHN
ncbi:MAG: hypothetical protein ABI237_07140 [Ginsengibacter sp.]